MPAASVDEENENKPNDLWKYEDKDGAGVEVLQSAHGPQAAAMASLMVVRSDRICCSKRQRICI